jgi:hypothetical protein
MIRLIATGALHLIPEHVARFDLGQVNDAVAHGGPFDRTVLTPMPESGSAGSLRHVRISSPPARRTGMARTFAARVYQLSKRSR